MLLLSLYKLNGMCLLERWRRKELRTSRSTYVPHAWAHVLGTLSNAIEHTQSQYDETHGEGFDLRSRKVKTTHRLAEERPTKDICRVCLFSRAKPRTDGYFK